MEINKKFEHTFSVKVDNTVKRTFPLDKNSPLAGCKILSFKTRRGNANNKSLQGETIVGDAVFEGAFLVLKVGQTEVLNRVPLVYMESATDQYPAEGYPILLEGIDFSQAFVEVATGVALTANEVFEFTAVFTKQ